MAAHQRGKQQLLFARKAGHVGVLEEIRAVTVVLGMGDVEARFVQPRRPAQYRLGQRVFQAPFGLDLFQEPVRRWTRRDRPELIDVVALFHGAHAAHARILVREAAHQVVEQSLPHGAFGHANPVDAEVFDHLHHDRQAGRKYRRPLGVHFRKIELVHVSRGDHPFGQHV